MRLRSAEQRALLLKLLWTALYLGILALLYHFHVPCLYRHFLQIRCPGCGMTHAWLSLSRGNIAEAFSYHPLFWTVPILYYFFLKDGKVFRERWVNTVLLGVMLGGYAILFVLRLVSK